MAQPAPTKAARPAQLPVRISNPERVVFPGFGPPGLPGYDATPQNPRCG